PVFRDDRDARDPHDCGRGIVDHADRDGSAQSLHPGMVHAGGYDRAVLALRRYCLDISVSAVVLDRTDKMSHPVAPVKLYVGVFAALIALTITTVAVSKIELGEFN